VKSKCGKHKRKIHKRNCRKLTDGGIATDISCGPQRIIAATAHVLAIGVDRFLSDAIVAHIRNTVVPIVLVEVECRRSDDTLPEVSQPEIKVFASINLMMFIARLLVVKTRLVRGCPSSDPTETALRNAPGPAQHLYPST